jgi:cytoskeletal protein CcmA (bactofilin family)
MFRKDETANSGSVPSATTPPTTARKTPSSGSPSRIGSGLLFKGEIKGEEDLLIEGRLEGQVHLETRSVTVGKGGQVTGDVYAKAITVIGEVHGNLYSDSEVLVESDATIEGNLHSPRVNLKDGCRFQGSIDMSSGIKAQPRPVSGQAGSGQKPSSNQPGASDKNEKAKVS